MPVGTLERGLSILQFFKSSPEATIPEVADALGLSRSTTYRIAERLRELGFLEVNASTNRWRLGREAVQLGVVALQSTDVMQVAPELLQALLQMAGEAVNLAVFDADSMVLLYREQGPQSVTISSRLGSHRPMHASSLGKAFLAAMGDAERRVLIGRIALKRYTEQTITSAGGARSRDRRDQGARLFDRPQRVRGDARLLRGGGVRPSRPAGGGDQRFRAGRAGEPAVRADRRHGLQYGAGDLDPPRLRRRQIARRSLTLIGARLSLNQ